MPASPPDGGRLDDWSRDRAARRSPRHRDTDEPERRGFDPGPTTDERRRLVDPGGTTDERRRGFDPGPTDERGRGLDPGPTADERRRVVDPGATTDERRRLVDPAPTTDERQRARPSPGDSGVLEAATGEPAAEPGTDIRALPVAPVRRLLSLALAGLSALLAVGLIIGAQITHGSYAVVIFAVQVLFVVVWTVANRPPAPRVVAGVGLAVAVGADVAAAWVSPASLIPLAYATAGGFVIAVIGQLLRPAGRVRVTESLGSSLVVVLGVVAYAALIVLSREPLGTQVIVACLLAVGVALAAAHLADMIAPVPRVAPPVTRGGTGVVVGAMLGTAAAGLAGYYQEGLSTLPTALGGLAAAVIALMADLSANYAEASRRLAGATPALWLVRHMQGPLSAFALAAPTAYAASALLARGL